jgi:hypothetical protein
MINSKTTGGGEEYGEKSIGGEKNEGETIEELE